MTPRTYLIPVGRKAALETVLAKLAARGAKRGLPDLAWAWGKAVEEQGRVRVPLAFTGERPRYAGWAFVATLQHVDGANVVRTIPGCAVHEDCRAAADLGRACSGADLPPAYATRGPVCDHCQLVRRRKDTFVLFHADSGRHAQVGSTCIAEFLGSDAAENAAAHAEVVALAASAAEGAERPVSTGTGPDATAATYELGLTGFLVVAAWCVRVHGCVSRAAAQEHGGRATADIAWALSVSDNAREHAGYAPTAEDADAAARAEAWAEGLTDAAIERSTGNYLADARAIARSGLVGHRTAGIAASFVAAERRAAARDAEAARAAGAAAPRRSVHLGAVGERVAFGRAGKALPKGATALDAAPATLVFVREIDGAYGVSTLLKFATADGATLVWFASGARARFGRGDVGKRYGIVGEVKEHSVYQGEKQTVLTRCAVAEVGT